MTASYRLNALSCRDPRCSERPARYLDSATGSTHLVRVERPLQPSSVRRCTGQPGGRYRANVARVWFKKYVIVFGVLLVLSCGLWVFGKWMENPVWFDFSDCSGAYCPPEVSQSDDAQPDTARYVSCCR
ncbi:hypothetical protein GCM10027088_58570 [Nocardia goodfellowii]|uniref:Uncharacterized protein n=1 Tax=Nocardia goodfellowii TaxID=882446 RepID=A0ABS4QI29_9NOCA|nr:hypothetical protein [Nocardia goodfellowii]